MASIPYPKVPLKLPDVMSRDEVEQLLEKVHSLKHQALFMTAYGAGLRISEACALRTTDIDRERMLIHVRGGGRRRPTPGESVPRSGRRTVLGWIAMSPKRQERRLSAAALDRAYRRVCRRLGAPARGRVVALDARTGQDYVGVTIDEALALAHCAVPDGYFVIRRLGYRGVFRLRTRP